MITTIDNKEYEIIIMNSFYKRLKGLMFKKERINKIYMFPRCSSIHTFFMRQNIDICMLDKNYNITYLKSNLKPNRILIKKGYYTLEMPLKTAEKLKNTKQLKISKK